MKSIGQKIWRGWLAFGHAVGWFNSRLILSILYLIAFAPFGLAVRLFGGDPLHLKWGPRAKPKNRPATYFTPKEPVRQDLEGARHLF